MGTFEVQGKSHTIKLRIKPVPQTGEVMFDVIDGSTISCNNISPAEVHKIINRFHEALKELELAQPKKVRYWVATSHPSGGETSFICPYGVGEHSSPKEAAETRLRQLMSGAGNSYGKMLVSTSPGIIDPKSTSVVEIFDYVKPFGDEGKVFKV